MNTFKLEIPSIGYTKEIRLKVECECKKSRPAKNFEELVNLVKQAEDMLMINGHDDVGDRIHIIRGIYYGTEWSLDYAHEKSEMRNIAFNFPYTATLTPPDAREELKCLDDCKADLFHSLYNSYEVFDSPYRTIDFGHLVIGLEARKSFRSKNFHIPTQGGTGLEICTWVGDLGGGVGKLSLDRVKKPDKRAKILFPVHGKSYGATANLEGDVAGYVVGMDESDPSKIDDMGNNFSTIYEALQDYFDCKWDDRTMYFLQMIGGKFDRGKHLTNRESIEKKIAEHLEGFASWYLLLRMKDKNSGDLEEFLNAAAHFEPLSQEVASIFMDALLHVVNKSKGMLTTRTNPRPSNKTVRKKAEEKFEEIKKYLKGINLFD